MAPARLEGTRCGDATARTTTSLVGAWPQSCGGNTIGGATILADVTRIVGPLRLRVGVEDVLYDRRRGPSCALAQRR